MNGGKRQGLILPWVPAGVAGGPLRGGCGVKLEDSALICRVWARLGSAFANTWLTTKPALGLPGAHMHRAEKNCLGIVLVRPEVKHEADSRLQL